MQEIRCFDLSSMNTNLQVSELLMQISTLRRLIKRQTASFFRIVQDDYSRKNRNLQYDAEDSDSDANESTGLLPRMHGKHVNKRGKIL